MDAFLRHLERCGNVAEACRESGLNHGQAYALRRRRPDFALAWQESLQQFSSLVFRTTRSAALEGIPEEVIYKGQRMYERDPETGDLILDGDGRPIPLVVKRFNARMLESLQKAVDPQRFSSHGQKNIVEEGALIDDAVDSKLAALEDLSDDERAALGALLQERLSATKEALAPQPLDSVPRFERGRPLSVDSDME